MGVEWWLAGSTGHGAQKHRGTPGHLIQLQLQLQRVPNGLLAVTKVPASASASRLQHLRCQALPAQAKNRRRVNIWPYAGEEPPPASCYHLGYYWPLATGHSGRGPMGGWVCPGIIFGYYIRGMATLPGSRTAWLPRCIPLIVPLHGSR